MVVLDTDHMTLLERRQSAGSQLLQIRLERLDTGSHATAIVQAGTVADSWPLWRHGCGGLSGLRIGPPMDCIVRKAKNASVCRGRTQNHSKVTGELVGREVCRPVQIQSPRLSVSNSSHK